MDSKKNPPIYNGTIFDPSALEEAANVARMFQSNRNGRGEAEALREQQQSRQLKMRHDITAARQEAAGPQAGGNYYSSLCHAARQAAAGPQAAAHQASRGGRAKLLQ